MRKYLIFTILLIILGSTGLHAQIKYPHQRKWEFSFFGGVAFPSDESSATPVQGSDELRLVELKYPSGYLLGVRISENLGQHVGAELEYSFYNSPLSFLGLRPDLPRFDADHSVHSVVYNLVYYPQARMSRVRPFFGVGGGTSFFQVAGNDKTLAELEGFTLRDRWKFVFSFSGGVKAMLNDNWGVRLDVRNQISGVPDYGLPSVAVPPDGVGMKTDGLMNRWMFSGGISYYWGY